MSTLTYHLSKPIPKEIKLEILSPVERKLLVNLWKIFVNYPGPPIEKKRFIKALKLAYKWHTKLKRKSGESYFIHDLRCATRMLIMGEGLNMATIMLLHEFVEDDSWDFTRLSREFGNEIAANVIAISKPPKSFGTSQERMQAHLEIMEHEIVGNNNYKPLFCKAIDRHDNIRDTAGLSLLDNEDMFTETETILLPFFNRLIDYVSPHSMYFYKLILFEMDYACANFNITPSLI